MSSSCRARPATSSASNPGTSRGRRQRRPLLFAPALAVAFVACTTGPIGTAPQAIPSGAGVGTRAAFAVAAPAGLIGFDATGKELGQIVRLPPGTTASSPTLDPRGKTIVFALSQTTDNHDLGSDIYSVNLDGSDLRPLLKHDRPGVFYASPALDRGGGFLYVHRRAADLDLSRPAAARSEDSIERVDLSSGERRTIVTDAAEPTISPDGQVLVFVHLNRGDQSGLWTARADGSASGPFLKSRDTFVFLQAPRISPTGRELVLSSAGHVVTRLSEATASKPTGGGRSIHLDIPSEIFIAPLGGGALRSIATTGDDVVPAWSPDGSRIAYIALATFYVISSADGSVQVAQPIGVRYGDPVWLH